MKPEEFEKRIASVRTEEPDEIDLAMLREAERAGEGTVGLEAYKKELEEYSGRFVLRIPRSLHRELKEAADREGVSLNQYVLYKLAK